MGVSFKISKVGSRFKPKPVLSEKNSENSVESSQPKAKKDESNAFITTTSARKLGGRDEDAAGFSSPSLSSGRRLILSEDDTSFVLNLYLDGYSIGKPSESENLHNVVFQDGAKLLHPYDRSSESLFAAIESGRLPGDILEDMPCKYMDGQIICEVRDYRRCILDSGCNIPSRDMSPVVTKVQLKMSLENVVKDIPLIADDSWSYGDLMEVESRILRALQPKLCLDPTPRLDRLSDSSLSPKLDLGLSGMRKRRLRQISEVVTSFSKPHGKKTCLGSFSESSGLGESGVVSADIMSQPAHTQNVCSNVPSTRLRGSVHDNSPQAIHAASPESKFQLGDQRIMPHISGSALNTSSGAFPAVHDMTKVHPDNMNSTNLLHAKMENEEGQLSSFSSLNKKARHFGPEGTLPPLMGSCINSLQPSDMQWRNPPHHQGNARGMLFPNTGIQKYAHVMSDGASNQEGMTSASIGQLGRKYGVSGEHLETEKIDTPEVKHGKNVMQMFDAENNHMDPSILQRVPTQIMRSGLNQGVWNNIGYVDKDPRKEDLIQRRKLIQSPRNSAGSGAHFPLSAKSAELSCGSLVNQYAAVPSAAAPGSLQREKSGVPSIPAGGRTPSVNSSANDSVHQHHQSHVPAKRRSNSLPKTQAMSGVGSPASVSNANVPMSAASPSVGTSPFADQTLIERFSKIEMVNMKHQLNAKKNRSDDFSRTSSTFCYQLLRARLSDSNNDESTMSLSKSLAGGNINLPKIRVLTLIQPERTLQGNSVPFPPRAKTRMIMSEKPGDGTVAMHYGDLEDVPYLNAEDYLPNLPNTHFADLLAAEFSRLVDREGYYVEDRVHCRPPHTSISTSTQPSAAGVASSNPTTEMQQHSEAVSSPQTGEGAKPFSANTSVNPSPNFLPSSGRLPLGSPQALQMSQGLLHGVSMPARSQQLDPPQTHQQQQSPLQNQPPLIQPQQQQQTQFQRSLMMPPNSLSPIQNSNFQLGNQMMNKPSLHVLQQQQQPQLQPQMQQQHMQRKMMTGGAAMGMGNMANNMAGGLNIGGARGIGAAGITAPMVAIPGMGNMGQNPMSINHASNFSNALSQHIRSGALTEEQAQIFASRMRVAQNRSVLGGPQSSVPDIAGTRQMQPGSTGHSMLGQTLNRGNFSPMQRTLGQMTPQKLMPGMHAHVSSQQQLQQQQRQQQLQLRQQLQQQQLQQLPPSTTQLQQETSPLQAVVSPQISSSSTLGIPHSLNQQPTPQQQQASPQISSGTMQPMASVNPEAGAASPQLSSGGNIANSPMDFQGVNKSSSLGNT